MCSFLTQPTSIGLNVGLDVICLDSDPEGTRDDALQKDKHLFGVQNVTLFPHLRSASLKGLKYGNDSYTASLSPI
jgi:protein downstream neighbor of Son